MEQRPSLPSQVPASHCQSSSSPVTGAGSFTGLFLTPSVVSGSDFIIGLRSLLFKSLQNQLVSDTPLPPRFLPNGLD